MRPKKRKKEEAVKVPYGIKRVSSDASTRPVAKSEIRQRNNTQHEGPQLRLSVGSLSVEDSKRFDKTLNWFLADIVRHVMARREVKVDGMFEAQR
jgi:hypothetical protein